MHTGPSSRRITEGMWNTPVNWLCWPRRKTKARVAARPAIPMKKCMAAWVPYSSDEARLCSASATPRSSGFSCSAFSQASLARRFLPSFT